MCAAIVYSYVLEMLFIAYSIAAVAVVWWFIAALKDNFFSEFKWVIGQSEDPFVSQEDPSIVGERKYRLYNEEMTGHILIDHTMAYVPRAVRLAEMFPSFTSLTKEHRTGHEKLERSPANISLTQPVQKNSPSKSIVLKTHYVSNISIPVFRNREVPKPKPDFHRTTSKVAVLIPFVSIPKEILNKYINVPGPCGPALINTH